MTDPGNQGSSQPRDLQADGRTVIVTGAGRGIGRAHAEMFASLGANVVVNGRTKATVDAAVTEIVAAGGEAVANIGDISDRECAEALVDQAISLYGRVDVVVNNAGVRTSGAFHELPDSALKEMLDVNLLGTWNVTRAAWPHMVRQRYGRVVLTLSHAVFGGANAAGYAVTKAALIGLMRTLSIEGSPHGITANSIVPLAVTDMMRSALEASAASPAGATDPLVTSAPFLVPARITPVLVWLTHEICDVSGEIFTVGGGRVGRLFLAETAGYHELALTPEAVRDHWSEICAEDGYVVPSDYRTSLMKVIDALQTVTDR